MKKLWGSRFEQETHSAVEDFTGSLAVDKRLWSADIQGSLAHARMLAQVGILTLTEGNALGEALLSLHEEIATGKVTWDPKGEDIHSEVERLLSLKLGELAGKLHTARSRNDQVATATRLYLLQETEKLTEAVRSLQTLLIKLSESHLETILPGTTHLQPAQPVSLAHHLMAYFWMLQRDRERFADTSKRVSSLPLGSGALAGTSFPIDRESVRTELGFASLCENSLDAVSDRDFVVEFLNAASLTMMHLSRLSEELILWSSPALGYVELSDATTTGSSMMPQKKNPDVAELIRGRSGRLTAAWVGAMTMLKGLPLSYNRDLQEDKVHLFEGLDATLSSVKLMELMLSEAKFFPEKMKVTLETDFSNATDLADYLVKQGLAFRDAHEVTGKVVRECLKQKLPLQKLPLETLKEFSPLFEKGIHAVLEPMAVMKARISRGGTAPEAVKVQIQKAKELLDE